MQNNNFNQIKNTYLKIIAKDVYTDYLKAA